MEGQCEEEEDEEEENGEGYQPSTSTLRSDKSGNSSHFSLTQKDETRMLRGGGTFQIHNNRTKSDFYISKWDQFVV